MVQNGNHKSTYNLKAVVQETGLKPDTLRAWERRYGLPQPERTEGGHRLYSQRDIVTLKWLIARQQEGLSISRAINLWHQLEEEGKDPLLTMLDDSPADPSLPEIEATGDVISKMRQKWVEACLVFDERQAEAALSQAFALYPPEVVCFELLQKGIYQIGQGWYRNEITAQQEHFASALAMRRLEALVSATPAPTRPGRILIGCPPTEEHTFSPLLLTLILRRQGWEVLYLGANVPVMHLAGTVAAAKPQLVILAAQRLDTAATMLGIARILRKEEIPLAFGGRIFNLKPRLRQLIPGHFLGEQLEKVAQQVAQLLASPAVPLPVAPPDETHQAALTHYRERKAIIEAEIWDAMKDRTILHTDLINVNQSMSTDIIAALTLGDMSLLESDMSWLENLLDNHQLPVDELQDYLNHYYRAAKFHLDERGSLVVEWLANLC